MATYNGWPVLVMPSTPSPKSIEFTYNSIVAVSNNPFSGSQQIQDWGTAYMEADLTMPPMTQAVAQPWINFLAACRGPLSVFLLPSNLVALALTPSGTVPNGYWRLDAASLKWSVTPGLFYGLQFKIREAI